MSDYEEIVQRRDSRVKNERNYYKMQEKSINGKPIRRSNKKTKKKYAVLNRKIKCLLGGALIGATITVGISNLADKTADKAIVGGAIRDFYTQVINPETHLTADHINYYYDYSDIYHAMCEMDDFDEALYLTTACIGRNQTEKVIAHGDYDSIDSYIAAKGYTNEKDFVKDVQRKIVLGNEINKRQQELNKMLEVDVNHNIDTNNYGGIVK